MNARYVTAEASAEIRESILDAARSRFSQYGYGKTTMAEIARDCGMSAANLYRYFENKLEIKAALASECLSEDEHRLAEIASRSDLSVAERLEAIVMATLESTYHHWQEAPKIEEMVDAVCSARPDMVRQHISVKQRIISNLLTEGVRAGVLSVEDTDEAADLFLTANLAFDLPHLLHLYDYEDFERRARALTRLLVKGMSADVRR